MSTNLNNRTSKTGAMSEITNEMLREHDVSSEFKFNSSDYGRALQERGMDDPIGCNTGPKGWYMYNINQQPVISENLSNKPDTDCMLL
jgi:hypothetical protein